jgi:hypothetical protein
LNRIADALLAQPELIDVVARDSDWWTVMVASPGGNGVTLPQNVAPGRLIAAFADPADRPDIVAYDPARSALVELGLGHCAPPSRGRCTPGLCGGCQPRRVWDKSSGLGIQCRCPDRVG